MKVLHFFKTYFPDTMGGMEQVINQLIRATTPLGVESEVLTLTPEKNPVEKIIDGHKVHRCHTNIEIASTPFSISAISKFKELAKTADIIHYHFPYPFADMLHFITGIKKPTVVSYQSDIVKQKKLLKIYTPLQNKFLKDVTSIVATSPNYVASSPVLEKFKEKVTVIPNGIDQNSYPLATEELTQSWKNKLPKKFFLFVGVLRYYKGLHILIEALQGIDYPTVIAGSGPLEDELKQQAKSAGLNSLYFIGQVSDTDKVALLNLCYAFVFPSHLRSEAFGISLLEAAMFGKPMISCEMGTGTSFINLNGETGLVVPANDSGAFKQAIEDLWYNPQKALEMSQKAQQRYQEYFTAVAMGKAYFQLYQELLQ